ncbi:hypothetical protein M3Y97_00086400 [Aphelenchoides bicaudatus]|nr:hypothetical protein M3Y97_00086400 [Aphelenchoides bicaudatus]
MRSKMLSPNLLIISLFLLGHVWCEVADETAGQDVKLFRPYDIVQINDPSNRSAGIYFRISQKGVDYLAALTSEGLPLIFHRMVLPSISESGFTVKDAVITRITRPDISVKFVENQGLDFSQKRSTKQRCLGIDVSIRLPEFEIRGDAELDVLFVNYKSQLVALSNNMTVTMRVAIQRQLSQNITKVNVTQCSVDPGPIKLNYYGGEAGEFYAIGNLIQSEIDKAIRDKLCILPSLLRDFISEKIDLLMQPPKENASLIQANSEASAEDNTVIDHLCGQSEDSFLNPKNPLNTHNEEDESSEPDVSLNKIGGSWVPDLTLRYPPTFSKKDLIFGVDGGFLVDGQPASNFYIERPRLDNLSVLRDQMLGLIVSEYVPNTLFQQLFDREIGSVSVVYSFRHIPRIFQPLAKLLCSDCKLLIRGNLTKVPVASVNRNGVQLNLEGDVSALFFRKNVTHNILTANVLLRANIKPHFRQSRLFSDVMLAGVDFKVDKSGMSGLMSGAVRKIVSFMVPRAIWPKIQQRLRMAISYKGVQIPRFCTLALRNLHLDWMDHAAVLSTDFDVDLPLLVRSFKQFMDSKLKSTQTLAEYREGFRYL